MVRAQTNRNGRSLVRWNDNTDKKLLLAIQSACNAQGLTLPWDRISDHLAVGATGNAVIQHLAKLRQRMSEAGLPVPPALRRRGGREVFKAGNPSAKVLIYEADQYAHTTEDEDDGGDVDLNADPESEDEFRPSNTVKFRQVSKRCAVPKKNLGWEGDSDEEAGKASSPGHGRVAIASKFLQLQTPERKKPKPTTSANSANPENEQLVWTLPYEQYPKINNVMKEPVQTTNGVDEYVSGEGDMRGFNIDDVDYDSRASTTMMGKPDMGFSGHETGFISGFPGPIQHPSFDAVGSFDGTPNTFGYQDNINASAFTPVNGVPGFPGLPYTQSQLYAASNHNYQPQFDDFPPSFGYGEMPSTSIGGQFGTTGYDYDPTITASYNGMSNHSSSMSTSPETLY